MRAHVQGRAAWLAMSASMLALFAVTARADSSAQFWGWTTTVADGISYNLQIPAQAVAAGDHFAAAHIWGSHQGGAAELICRQDGAFTSISCIAPAGRYDTAWATVRLENAERGETVDVTTQPLKPAAIESETGWQRLQLFQPDFGTGGPAQTANGNGNSSGHEDENGGRNANGNSPASTNANANAGSNDNRTGSDGAANGNGNAASESSACDASAANGNTAADACP